MVLSRRRVLREGLVAGLIGAGSVASWFLVVDIIAGRPFFTPAVLGSAVFWGLRDATTVIIGFQAVASYTVIHVAGESREAGARTGNGDESASTGH